LNEINTELNVTVDHQYHEVVTVYA